MRGFGAVQACFAYEAQMDKLADALGMEPGPPEPMALGSHLSDAGAAAWDAIRARHGLSSPGLREFVGLSLEYADYQMRHGAADIGAPTYVSTVKIRQAGFHEAMDTEAMFRRWFRAYQDRGWLPRP